MKCLSFINYPINTKFLLTFIKETTYEVVYMLAQLVGLLGDLNLKSKTCNCSY